MTNLEGFDKLFKKAEAVGGDVPVLDVMTDSFMQSHTEFNTFEDMVHESGITDAEQIETPAFSEFIASKTQFADWEDMLKIALTEYLQSRF